MNIKTYSFTTGLLFSVIALVHLYRIFTGWSVMVGDASMPIWASSLATIVSGSLGYWGLRYSCKRPLA